MRYLLLLIAIGCGHDNNEPACVEMATLPEMQCSDAPSVTLAKLQVDVLAPTCAKAACHDGKPGTISSIDYTTVEASLASVGKDSAYGDGLRVVDEAGRLANSTMWLKLIGGSPKYKGPACTSVGGIMPFGATQPIPDAALGEVKGWICSD